MAKKKDAGPSPRSPDRSVKLGARGLFSVQALSDGTLLTGGWDRSCRWELATGALVSRYEARPTMSVNWMTHASPDERRVVAGYGDCSFVVYDAHDASVVRLHELDGIVTSVSIDAASRVAMTGQPQKKLRLWDLETGEPIATLAGKRSYCWKAAIAPDASMAASIGGPDKLVHVWDLDVQKELSALSGHQKSVSVIAFGPSGVLASGSADKSVRLWTCTHGERGPRATLSGHRKTITGLAFASDGSRLASSSDDGTVRVWSVADARLIEVLGAGEPLACVTWRADGAVIAGGAQAHVWHPIGAEPS